MTPEPLEAEPLLLPSEVAKLLRVDVKTIARWAAGGKFPPGSVVRTLGGHRRIKRSAVELILRGEVDPVVALAEAIADQQTRSGVTP